MKYHVVIMGAGVAGESAALRLAEQNMQVVVVERNRPTEVSEPRPEWVNPHVLDQLKKMQVDPDKCVGKPFEGAAFHSPEMGKSTITKAQQPPAYRIDYPVLLLCLNKKAVESGVVHHTDCTPTGIEVAEAQVTINFGEEEPVEADFLLRASGAENDPNGSWVAQSIIGFKKSQTDNFMHWILSRKEANLEGNWWFDDSQLIFQRFGSGALNKAHQQFGDLLDQVIADGALPAQAMEKDFEVKVRSLPKRMALEIDSHVDKRGLVIGDAGGFVAAASREGIYPAMWSAELASRIIVKAVKSSNAQDELRQFSALWRTTMAEYLRRPNADAHFLLPLIFSNQQMADRMAAAFWRGENI